MTLLTREQVAAQLQIRVSHVDLLARQNKLPYVSLSGEKTTRCRRYLQSDVDKLIRQKRVAV